MHFINVDLIVHISRYNYETTIIVLQKEHTILTPQLCFNKGNIK